MFKKLKDKIAEEVKQSPSKISATVSQLAQAVVSPSSSSVVEPSTTTDNHFSISEDTEETPQNSPSKWGFTSVDLREMSSPQPPGTGIRSRRSSASSVLSDASSLFPVYESPGNTFHLQSDLESASELDDSFSSRLPSASKEQLVNVLRKTQQRYNKYKGRYSDLARHYRELERENLKAKTILTESQDKALRRIAELKEQCLLEQRAKAHLEEILRNDLEEKDHLIMTLNTKIELLKSDDSMDASFNADNSASRFAEVPATSKFVTDVKSTINEDTVHNTGTLIAVSNSTAVNELDLATSQSESEELLREKVRKLEMLLAKCKDAIKIHKEKVKEFSAENQYLKIELSDNKKSSSDQLQLLNTNLSAAKEEISLLLKQEEESALSLAETKRSIHSEMEIKEEQITHLRDTIHGINEQKQELIEKCNQMQIQLVEMKRSQELGITSENEKQIKELSRVKQEAVKLLQAETQKNIDELKSEMHGKIQELELQVQSLSETNKELETQVSTLQNNMTLLESQNVALLNEAEDHQAKELKQDSALLNESRQALENSNDALKANSELQQKIDELLAVNSSLKANSVINNSEKLEILESKSRELEKENGKYQDEIKQFVDNLHQLEISLVEKDTELNIKCKEIVEFEEKQVQLEKAHTELINNSTHLKLQLDDVNKSKLDQLTELKRSVYAIEQLEIKNKQLLNNIDLLESDILRRDTVLKNSEEMIVELKTVRDKELIESNLALQAYKDKMAFQKLGESNISQENEKLEFTLLQKDKHIVELNNELRTLRDEIKRLNDTVTGEISSIRNQMEFEAARANALMETLNEEKSVASTTITKLQKQIELEKSRASDVQEQIESEKAQSACRIKELREQLENERTKGTAAMTKHDQLEIESTRLNSIITTLEGEKYAVSATLSRLEEQIESEKAQGEAVIKELHEQLENERAKRTAAMCEQEQLEIECTQLYAVITNLEEEKSTASITLSRLEEQIESEKAQGEAVIKELREQLEDERTKGTAAMCNKEQLEIESSRLNAIIKTLEDEKYAISATLSRLEEHIESEKAQGEAVIMELREQLEDERTKGTAAMCNKEQLEIESSRLNAIIKTLEDEKYAISATLSRLEEQIESEKAQGEAVIMELREQLEDERTKGTAAMCNKEQLEIESSRLNAIIKTLEDEKYAISATLTRLEEQIESEKAQGIATMNKLHDEIEYEKIKSNQLEDKLQEIDSRCEEKISESSNLIIEQQMKYEALVKSHQSPDSVVETLNNRNRDFIIASERDRKLLIAELNLLQVRDQELESMLQVRTEDLLEKTNSYDSLLKKYAELEELPKQIELLSEDLSQMNAKNTMLLEQIQSATGNQPDWCKVLEEVKSDLQTLVTEKHQLEVNLDDEVEREAEMFKIIQQIRIEKEQLLSQVVEMQSMQERIDKQASDIDSLEAILNKSLQTIEQKEAEINDIQESHCYKIKQLARDFDDKLHDREEEILTFQEDQKDNQEQTGGVLTKQLRNQIKSLKSDVRQSEDTIDNLKEKHNDGIKSKEFEVSSLEERMRELYLTHETELRENDTRWRQCLDQEIERRDIAHKEEMTALSKEWHLERKELENTSLVAVKAVESGTGSLEMMHRQLLTVTNELKEAKWRHEMEGEEMRRLVRTEMSDGGTTELEYLRNILFEYMMGRETTVLARVIATVLKFDQEQTNKVIEKEEQKQSLLGQLGIL